MSACAHFRDSCGRRRNPCRACDIIDDIPEKRAGFDEALRVFQRKFDWREEVR